ncbi:MAG: hypothetical protein ABEH56_02740 [Salinirussus sp.]
MLDGLACTCEATDCRETLDEDSCMLVYRTDAGERRAYECSCGAVTVTVHR